MWVVCTRVVIWVAFSQKGHHLRILYGQSRSPEGGVLEKKAVFRVRTVVSFMSWIKQCSVEVREQRSEMKGATFPKYFVCVLATVGCKHCVPLTANTETKGHRPKNSLLILWFLVSVTVRIFCMRPVNTFTLLLIWSPVLNSAYAKPRKERVKYIPLYSFFWMIPRRLYFMHRRFGTPSLPYP